MIVIKNDEMTKNRRENVTERVDGGMIVSTNEEKCPVACFKLYLEKLNPNCEYLWQKPNEKSKEKYWYFNAKCGHNTISLFMKNISIKCKLSKNYTNHCIRATTITLLGATFSDLDIN